jgi:hypothetical protein
VRREEGLAGRSSAGAGEGGRGAGLVRVERNVGLRRGG